MCEWTKPCTIPRLHNAMNGLKANELLTLKSLALFYAISPQIFFFNDLKLSPWISVETSRISIA